MRLQPPKLGPRAMSQDQQQWEEALSGLERLLDSHLRGSSWMHDILEPEQHQHQLAFKDAIKLYEICPLSTSPALELSAAHRQRLSR